MLCLQLQPVGDPVLKGAAKRILNLEEELVFPELCPPPTLDPEGWEAGDRACRVVPCDQATAGFFHLNNSFIET